MIFLEHFNIFVYCNSAQCGLETTEYALQRVLRTLVYRGDKNYVDVETNVYFTEYRKFNVPFTPPDHVFVFSISVPT